MASRARKNRPSVRKKRGISVVLCVLAILVVVIGCGVFVVGSFVNKWLDDLPDYHSADAFNTSLPTVVYAGDGTTEIARLQLEWREPVELEDVGQNVIDATIAVEDARFYDHSGVDVAGIIRALINNLVGGRIEGASTITQQFVRNTILAEEMDEISIERKVREAYIAMEIEKMYSKEEILTMYLNTINYGAGAHGVEAAAQRYYSKHASELTLAEAALVAGIPQSPTYNDPTLFPDRAIARRNAVLDRMQVNHYITYEECLEAQAEPLNLNPSTPDDDGILAYPYFASYVRYLLYNDFDLSEADILKGGLKVYTTLDIEKQQLAEWAAALKRESMYDSSMEVAIAVVEPSTGYVQALVGGSDYYASQVNLATGQGGYGRPCGSVFKTFTLVTAIKKGIDPWTTYVDCTSPATVDGYTLENYANTNYGTKTIAGAFAVSSNTGFVRICASVGATEVAQTAYDLGITSNLYEREAYNSLTLGVQNITPLETANAFATIANGGVHHDVCAITQIISRDGEVIVDNTDPEKRAKRVISPEVAHAAQEVMKGVITGGTGTGAGLYSGQPVAGKTGTSEDYKDITFAGITPQLSMAIWIGDPTNVNSVPTGTAADVFHWYATEALAYEEVRDFDWAENPEYTNYEDKERHISYIYEDWRSDEDKQADEVEEWLSKWKAGEMKEKDLAKIYADNYDKLTVTYEYEFSDEYEEGIVISQSIDVEKHKVTVVVSKGKSDDAKKKEEEEKAAAEKKAAEEKAAAEKAAAEKEAADKAAAEKAAAEKAAAEKAAAEKAAAEQAAAEKAAAEKAAAEQAAIQEAAEKAAAEKAAAEQAAAERAAAEQAAANEAARQQSGKNSP